MDLINANVLITGGSEGIGFGLAKRFVAAGSNVMITGRNAAKLKEAAKEVPELKTYINDIGDDRQREQLAQHVQFTMPNLNVLINNAGIQRRVSLASDSAPWAERQSEIDILLAGPIHLNHLLIPLMIDGNKPGLIVNVTSGGAYIPQVFAPVYSACKAALHSYTMVLRDALKNTKCSVIELIPPAVQTNLASKGANHGVSLYEFCDTIFPKLIDESNTVIGFGPTADIIPELSGKPISDMFEAGLSRFPVSVYQTII